MERNKKKEGSGFYIAICCCIVIIAIVGYANRLSLKDDKIPEKQVAQATQVPEASQESKSEAAAMPPAEKPQDTQVSKAVQVEEKVSFNAPVSGKVIEEFSGDELVYNEALKDWRAHSGIDFSAKLGEKVTASAGGIVEDVFDSSMGRCVIVNHQNGFKTMYANLNENTAVKKGEEISQGDVIGTVGDTALGDATDEPHLHFEMSSNNNNVNPTEYFD